MSVVGAGDGKRLAIIREYGLWHIFAGDGEVTAPSLEKAIAQIAPNAPEDYVAHTAEVLEGLMGIGAES